MAWSKRHCQYGCSWLGKVTIIISTFTLVQENYYIKIELFSAVVCQLLVNALQLILTVIATRVISAHVFWTVLFVICHSLSVTMPVVLTLVGKRQYEQVKLLITIESFLTIIQAKKGWQL